MLFAPMDKEDLPLRGVMQRLSVIDAGAAGGDIVADLDVFRIPNVLPSGKQAQMVLEVFPAVDIVLVQLKGVSPDVEQPKLLRLSADKPAGKLGKIGVAVMAGGTPVVEILRQVKAEGGKPVRA